MSYQKNIISKYLLIWVGLCLFVAVVLHLLYTSDYEIELASIKIEERNTVQQTRDNIDYEFSRVLSDLGYLASQTPLGNYLDYPSQQNLDEVNKAFASIMHSGSGYYHQLRFIDMNGWENARVNKFSEQIQIVPRDQLQNKSGRYYFKEATQLKRPTEVYVSPIDLNIEHGRVVVPYQPVIRFATKIFRNGYPRGVLVVNYDAQHVLDSLIKADKELWLVNAAGSWLAGPEEKLEWGFMLADRADARFQDHFPDVWHMLNETEGVQQEYNAHGLFTHASINPAMPGSVRGKAQDSKDTRTLHIFAHIPRARLDDIFSGLTSRYLILFLSAVLVTGVSLHLLYRSSKISARSESEARHNKLKFVQLVEFSPDAMVICRPDGTIVQANQQAEQLFGYKRNELVGQPVDILIPEDKRPQHDGYIQSYVAAPAIRPMGAADAKLMALRKDGSEFPVSISLSPIDSGEDMLIASAIRDISNDRRAH